MKVRATKGEGYIYTQREGEREKPPLQMPATAGQGRDRLEPGTPFWPPSGCQTSAAAPRGISRKLDGKQGGTGSQQVWRLMRGCQAAAQPASPQTCPALGILNRSSEGCCLFLCRNTCALSRNIISILFYHLKEIFINSIMQNSYTFKEKDLLTGLEKLYVMIFLSDLIL